MSEYLFDLSELDVFDAKESQARKTEGMDAAAEAHQSLLRQAREVAVELCQKHGETDADEVGRIMYERHGVKSMGPTAGSIFRGGIFEFTGRRRLSQRKSNHARELKIWKLKR